METRTARLQTFCDVLNYSDKIDTQETSPSRYGNFENYIKNDECARLVPENVFRENLLGFFSMERVKRNKRYVRWKKILASVPQSRLTKSRFLNRERLNK